MLIGVAILALFVKSQWVWPYLDAMQLAYFSSLINVKYGKMSMAGYMMMEISNPIRILTYGGLTSVAEIGDQTTYNHRFAAFGMPNCLFLQNWLNLLLFAILWLLLVVSLYLLRLLLS